MTTDAPTTPDEWNDLVTRLCAEVDAPDFAPAHLLCDRHPADKVAFTVIEPDLSTRDLTYGWLKERSEQAAAAFATLGVGPGDRVATLMGKSSDLVVTLLGIWRLGAVQVPLFTAFAPPAIAVRVLPSETKVIVTEAGQRSKLLPGEGIPDDAPWQVVVAGEGGEPGDLHLDELLDAQQPGFPAAVRRGTDEIVRLFTSGTTGNPKGVVVPARALAAFQIYMLAGLDVREDDVFWNAADPGWAYGLYYGILGPMAIGRRNLLLHAGFSPQVMWDILEQQQVTNLAAAPTVYRSLRSSGIPAPDGLVLRHCSSAGEPLNPEIIGWAEQTLGVPIRDQYGQTEHGMCIVNPWGEGLVRPIKPGSMGHALPGWSAAVLEGLDDVAAQPGEKGRVCIDIPASPLFWFTEYANEPAKTAERLSKDGRWYVTGDVAHTDDDGYFFFSARDDDVIIMAGYRIGPFEVESVLVSHPDVAEAAVIGVPDELRGEVVEAFVVLRPGVERSDDLVAELQQHVKKNYAAHAYPRRIHLLEQLPKTASSKVQRFELRKLRSQQG